MSDRVDSFIGVLYQNIVVADDQSESTLGTLSRLLDLDDEETLELLQRLIHPDDVAAIPGITADRALGMSFVLGAQCGIQAERARSLAEMCS